MRKRDWVPRGVACGQHLGYLCSCDRRRLRRRTTAPPPFSSMKPSAKLVPLSPPGAQKRRLGLLDGRKKVPADFVAPLPSDIVEFFEGR